ncbi:Citrate synthase [Beutenbergia cavernae DSM 12333]|uniref:citrate synthase (unknown stereospecificity) n=1 Tax=Beutenbergia cavernae (strain ATCC BAA-8 / DSM 12333 / CCUG 43141 / JCM 11478 / NBRC 16432 / NCIMB 13614 / HKI 0122) TaxID=471853 RepID=C5BZH0_BEUC1|nr:citrate synthase [Beutenbergia cavernae]ACQ79142.1 Citrate synthase [Beutenbergia cavernae DSM 12333]
MTEPDPPPQSALPIAPISAIDPDLPSLAYRGHDLATLVGRVGFQDVWALLVDGRTGSALPPAEPFPLPVRTGDARVDVQSALAQLAPVWAFRPMLDLDAARLRQDLARASVMALSFVAQSARGDDLPAVPQREVMLAPTTAERFLVRWRGEADPAHARALDACWVAVAEHGISPSTRAARLMAGTGADAAACLAGAVAATSGPLAAGAAARAFALVTEADRTGDPAGVVAHALTRGPLMGFGHPSYRGRDPRATLLHAECARIGAPLLEAAEAVEAAGTAALAERGVPYTANVMFWAGILLDAAGVAPRMFTAMYSCGRGAGWSAHLLAAHAELLARTGRDGTSGGAPTVG